jgi:hypothetical protein
MEAFTHLTWRTALIHAQVSHKAKAVGLVLDHHANRDGICWPGLAVIGREAGLSVTTRRPTIRAIQELEAAALIDVVRSHRARKAVGERTSERDSNTYQLTIPNSALEALSKVRHDSASEALSTVHEKHSDSAPEAHELDQELDQRTRAVNEGPTETALQLLERNRQALLESLDEQLQRRPT